MNTLKIQIKPFYKNNPFHLKDDQIHILSTNKNEEEIKQLLLQMNYENYSIFIQLELENYNYGYLFIDHKEYDFIIIMILMIMKMKLNLPVKTG